MLRWFLAMVVAAVLSGFAGLLVTGEYAKEGPILVGLGDGHGVHLGDVFVCAGWVVAMAAVAILLYLSRRPVQPDTAVVPLDQLVH